eukprot:scaffold41304_cov19-Tisochrysis_lutea.AAC.1
MHIKYVHGTCTNTTASRIHALLATRGFRNVTCNSECKIRTNTSIAVSAPCPSCHLRQDACLHCSHTHISYSCSPAFSRVDFLCISCKACPAVRSAGAYGLALAGASSAHVHVRRIPAAYS